MRAKLLIAAMIASASLGLARQSEASACMDTFMNDTGLCLAQRDSCLANSSWWTSTCNLGYLQCEVGAELVYADCYYLLIQ